MSHSISFTFCLLIISVLFLSTPAFTANDAEPAQVPATIIKVANTQPVNSSIPLIFMADPGVAFIISAPSRQLQVRIESDSGVCAGQLLQTDESGVVEIPIAATARCVRPRLVIMH
ncbi:MAG: hypothetical protein L3J04_11680 [Robiginitomaculum sp.]|nr:hypothetical protein [Robiginitomaculum sp.]